MFFSKKNKREVTDVVYLDEAGYDRAIQHWAEQHPGGQIAVWFRLELDRLKAALPQVADRIHPAEQLFHGGDPEHPVIFAGHHPMAKNEQQVYDLLGPGEVTVYTHLQAPLLRFFGADRISEMMVRMGMSDNEALSHAMITRAIANAQEKIAKHCLVDMQARSEEEWLRINVNTNQL